MDKPTRERLQELRKYVEESDDLLAADEVISLIDAELRASTAGKPMSQADLISTELLVYRRALGNIPELCEAMEYAARTCNQAAEGYMLHTGNKMAKVLLRAVEGLKEIESGTNKR